MVVSPSLIPALPACDSAAIAVGGASTVGGSTTVGVVRTVDAFTALGFVSTVGESSTVGASESTPVGLVGAVGALVEGRVASTVG
jgi:hypothetical protein